MTRLPEREIRAVHDDHTIRVYQAYSDQIADAALAHGTFVSPPFSMTRMTWSSGDTPLISSAMTASSIRKPA